ncbi:T9SS type A sorting domain-containing protein [candidate division WOR-3 bacterium]|nr:T9SS type A sorting domain-containing protein [candidate division WOR-3 bacterium]
MRSLKLYIIISLFVIFFNLSAQIVIESDEIPHEVGIHWIKNSSIEVNVNLGTTGGPQTWDFTSQPMGAENSYLTIVDPASSPYIDSLPSANLVYRSPSDSDTVYQYYNRNSDFLIMLGMGGISTTTPFFWRYEPTDSIPSPQSYGNSHRFRYGFTETISPGNYMEYFHYGIQKYDAFGTVNIPYGIYECLRIRTYDTCAMIMYFSDIPILYDTTTYINYQFVAENYAAVVCVKSHPDEIDTNYSEAYILERLTSFTSGIKEHGKPTDIECTHYPQIFSDYTTIQYSLPETYNIELTVHDLTGRTVRKLVKNTQEKGNYLCKWYGNNDAGKKLSSGIYFYRLKVGNNKFTNKVLLIR